MVPVFPPVDACKLIDSIIAIAVAKMNVFMALGFNVSEMCFSVDEAKVIQASAS
jgi:hypothetical protein